MRTLSNTSPKVLSMRELTKNWIRSASGIAVRARRVRRVWQGWTGNVAASEYSMHSKTQRGGVVMAHKCAESDGVTLG